MWSDRADESWLCSVLAVGCGALPQRPTGPNDIPVAHLATNQQVWIHCWKGNYYLIDYGLAEQLGWIVADQTLIRPHDDGRGPQQSFDDAT